MNLDSIILKYSLDCYWNGYNHDYALPSKKGGYVTIFTKHANSFTVAGAMIQPKYATKADWNKWKRYVGSHVKPEYKANAIAALNDLAQYVTGETN